MRFEKHPDRLGVSFWLPTMLISGLVAGSLLGFGGFVEGDGAVVRKFGMTTAWLLGIIAVASASLGILVGVLNPYVGSRWMAALVGFLAVFPVVACAMIVMVGSARGWMEPLIVTLLIAAVIGGTYGALLYEP